jgi:GNAT superfamily N-acetyltransferase
MTKIKRKIDVTNITIKPVKWISPQLWSTQQSLFCASYRPSDKTQKTQPLPYECTNFYRMALAYDGDQMIGFITIVDFPALINYIVKEGGSVHSNGSYLWDDNRPATLNRHQIETCWVNHRYQGKGIATMLYRHAIDKMGATHIHIEESRVIDKLDYWRGLGFVNASLYKFNTDTPTLRLHLAGKCEEFSELNSFNLMRMFMDRNVDSKIVRNKKVWLKAPV